MSDGDATGAEQRRLAEADAGVPWRRWGPYLSERQWGTVREDYSADGDAWVVLHPRPGPLARVPLGRGRHRRVQRRPAAAVPRAGAVERPRPDPQGAALRPDQRRGQPRRGRQGVLLLPRRHAHPLVPAACSTSTRSGSSRTATSSRRTARAGRTEFEYELLDTGVFDDEPLLRRASSSTPRPAPEDILMRVTVHNRGPEAADLHLLPDAVVPQHLVLGRNGAAADRCRECAGVAASAGIVVDAEHARARPPVAAAAGGARAGALHRERDQRRAALRHRERIAVRQGRHRPVRRRTGDAGAVNPARRRHQGRRPLRARRSRPADRPRSGSG